MKKYIIDFDIKGFQSFVPHTEEMKEEMKKILPKNVYYYMGNSMIDFQTYAKFTDNIHTYYIPYKRYWRDLFNKHVNFLEAYYYKRLKRRRII